MVLFYLELAHPASHRRPDRLEDYLYESLGFELTHEKQGNQWGMEVTEQQFMRKR